MAEQPRKYAMNIPKMVAFGTGILALYCAAYGLYFSFNVVMTVIGGGLIGVVEQYKLPYLYPAFYSMLSVTIVCSLVLAWCGLDQVRLRLAYSKLFVWLCVFEILYVASFGGFLWALPDVGKSIGAASGVAISGLMPQFFLLLPLWAPFALAWAKRRLVDSTAGHLAEGSQTEAAKPAETTSGKMIRGKLLIGLVGGVGGATSFFLLLSIAMSSDTLNQYISTFTFHMVAFFMAGVCVIYAAKLDSPINPKVLGWPYTAVAVVLASYFAASLRFDKSLPMFSLLPMAVTVGIILNGFSRDALRNCLWAFAGSLFGIAALMMAVWALAAVFGIASLAYVKRTLDPAGDSFPLVFLIRHGFAWYGFTLGLLLSQPPPQRRDAALASAS